MSLRTQFLNCGLTQRLNHGFDRLQDYADSKFRNPAKSEFSQKSVTSVSSDKSVIQTVEHL